MQSFIPVSLSLIKVILLQGDGIDQCFLLQTDQREVRRESYSQTSMTDGETLDVEKSPTFYIDDAPLLQKETMRKIFFGVENR